MKRLKIRRVAITGAGGFIGRHLVADQLRRGREVVAMDVEIGSIEALRSNRGLTIVQGDFTDPGIAHAALIDVDACFHLASIHLESNVAEERFRDVNVEGAGQLALRCAEVGIMRLVHVSSVGIYGELTDPPADEETPPNPTTVYERTKLEGERQVRQAAGTTGLPAVVLRPAWVYGPGCPRTAKLVSAIQKRRFFLVGDGTAWRHPVHIDDALRALELAATHPAAPGRTYVFAGPKPVTIRELVNGVADVWGAPRPTLRLPKAVAWFGCAILEGAGGLLGKEPPFSRRSLKFFTGNSAFDTSRIERELGFRPVVELEEGLRRTLQATGMTTEAEDAPIGDLNRAA